MGRLQHGAGNPQVLDTLIDDEILDQLSRFALSNESSLSPFSIRGFKISWQ